MLYVVGITGSMGCGKSTVTRLLGEMGALTLDADQLAKEILAPGSAALQEVVARFGTDILIRDPADSLPQLNRSLLAERVFADPDALHALEAVVHPRVYQNMAAILTRWERESRAGNRSMVVVLEIPLLLETQADGLCDWIVVVTCGDQQVERLQTRPGLKATCRQNRIAQQMPEEEKCQHAHWIIDNRGDQAATWQQTQLLWAAIQTRLQTLTGASAWPTRWKPHFV